MATTTDEHVFFFWGNDCYSNFFKRDFYFAGVKFFCSEQAMMWAKAMYFLDYRTAREILQVDSTLKAAPVICKSLGRQVKNYDETSWANVRYDIVCQILLEKFSQNQDFGDTLIATGKRMLVEASPFDTIWGVGLDIRNPKIHHPRNWRGQNLLGKALVRVRGELIAWREYQAA